MDNSAQVVASAADTQQLSNVSFDTGNTAGAEFARILDGYRARADKLDETVGSIVGEDAQGNAANPQVQQLIELYSYAVDTQLIVRTSTQLSTGVRQLMSGQ